MFQCPHPYSLLDSGLQPAREFPSLTVYLPLDPPPPLGHEFPCHSPYLMYSPPRLQSGTCADSLPPKMTMKLVFCLLSSGHPLPKLIVTCQSSVTHIQVLGPPVLISIFFFSISLLNPTIMFPWNWLEKETGKGTLTTS